MLVSPLTALNHPAFQSLLLPLLLAALGMAMLAALRRLLEARSNSDDWTLAGALLGLCVPMALLAGLNWPALAHAQKLPWIVLAGVAVALWAAARNQAARAGATAHLRASWLATAVLWLLACVWLAGAQAGWFGTGLAGLGGLAILALLATAPSALVAAAVLCTAALGLALLVANGGSLLLAQLAMMVVCCTAVPGVWAWLRAAAGVRLPVWLLQPLALAGLAIGWAWVLSTSGQAVAAPAQLGLLALAFVVPALLGRLRWLARHARWLPLVAALLAALPAAGALGWQFHAATSSTAPSASDGALPNDDPYYKPTWP